MRRMEGEPEKKKENKCYRLDSTLLTQLHAEFLHANLSPSISHRFLFSFLFHLLAKAKHAINGLLQWNLETKS